MFERLMFKKIELWVIGILFIVALIGVVIFGAIVRATALGSERYGFVGDLALQIAEIPINARQVKDHFFHGHKRALWVSESRFEGRSGFEFSYSPGARPDAEYLLLSRYDGDVKRSIVELVDMNTQTTVHVWAPDFAEINNLIQKTSKPKNKMRLILPERFRITHPLLTEWGDIIFHSHSTLDKIDICGKPIWTVNRSFHHSTEMDGKGNYLVLQYIVPQTIFGVSEDFMEDGIVLVSPDGNILFEKSVPEMLIENGYSRLVYGQDFYTDDPTHLNDAQEVKSDGPYWKKGDIFLSLRNVSAIVLYRPSENRIIWLKQGPWVNQHDVDILDDRRIAVFNNNKVNFQLLSIVEGANEVMVYDFSTETVSSPYQEDMRRHNVRTVREGRSEIMPDGSVFLEETTYGRALMLDRQGEEVWSYVNRASDEEIYLLNWSRVISRETGDRIGQLLASTTCPAL